MSHQDRDGHTASAAHHQDLKHALDALWKPTVAAPIRFRNDSTWSPRSLVYAAMLWNWSDEKTLTKRFVLARKVVIRMALVAQTPASSYQAFLKMLNTWTGALARALTVVFRERMQADLAARFLIAGFAVFGVDGSRLELPRTVSNETRFSPQAARRQTKAKPRHKPRRRARTRADRARRARQKKTNSPQMWLTTMFHVGTGLPWDWRTGPSDSSERGHMQEMLDGLPKGALVTADAGFVGYDAWEDLLNEGRHLLIRVGANVRLLKNLGMVTRNKGLVYLWPDRAREQKQRPLVLRLVVAVDGKQPVYLVTSVLDVTCLSDDQVREIYRRRWGIELFYRHFKQTFERRKLRSHCATNAELEATWSLLSLWALMLHAQVEQARLGIAAQRMSVAGVLQAYRTPLREYKSAPDPGESLRDLLSKAVIDPYQRGDKSSRDYPRKKQGHAIGAPRMLQATKAQIKAAREFRDQRTLRLTA
jgi:hypothetical protein